MDDKNPFAAFDWSKMLSQFDLSGIDTKALLDNQTETSGNHVMLELIGTTSERDAVGAKVTVASGGDTVTQWVTGGDGYFSSDEAYLDIAIAENEMIESINDLKDTVKDTFKYSVVEEFNRGFNCGYTERYAKRVKRYSAGKT